MEPDRGQDGERMRPRDGRALRRQGQGEQDAQASEMAPIAPTPTRQPAASAIAATDSRPPMPPSVQPAI